ncbi:MAG TPA: DCC1-like thiol-disulfide oxidoreductase family protein, partial [Gemmatimonadales bacterium]|nr:DCC1-like thiol-disulfide oxidoreductase family protein [Gemmatimonadales bacterium]
MWLLTGLLRWDRHDRIEPVPLQGPRAAELLADLAPDERMASWHLIAPDGTRTSAGAALPPLLRLLPGGQAPAALFARLPRLAERGYRFVADHRSGLAKLVPSGARQRARERLGSG